MPTKPMRSISAGHHLESGALVRLVPQCKEEQAMAGAISRSRHDYFSNAPI